jgi:lipoate-protein ligase A
MKYNRTDWHIPYYNMAFEDYIMSSDKFQDNYLFFYIHVPSIIIGQHQNAHAEINQKFVKERNIYVARRISAEAPYTTMSAI